jgi:hypothetical protein
VDLLSRQRWTVEPKSVKILDLKNRWASWTPGGNLNFHWKCMMSPAKILDYIVVHELAHLIFPEPLRKVLERGRQVVARLPRTQRMAAGTWGGDGL